MGWRSFGANNYGWIKWLFKCTTLKVVLISWILGYVLDLQTSKQTLSWTLFNWGKMLIWDCFSCSSMTNEDTSAALTIADVSSARRRRTGVRWLVCAVGSSLYAWLVTCLHGDWLAEQGAREGMMNRGREERQRSCGIVAINHAKCTYMHAHT